MGGRRMQQKQLIGTNIVTPILGLGTGPLGLPHSNLAQAQYADGPGFGTLANETLGVDAVIAALDAGIRFIDTAPWYGKGSSESFIGMALNERPDIKGQVFVATKIGHLYPHDSYDFSYDAARRSFDQSLERLGISMVSILNLHDPMGVRPSFIFGKKGAYTAMLDVRNYGMTDYLGVGADNPETASHYIASGMCDAAIVVGSWSLISQTANRFIIPWAERNSVGLIAATALERGILAEGFNAGRKYQQRHFAPEVRTYVQTLIKVCENHDVPLGAAAIQWCVRHPQFALCIPGCRSPKEVEQNVAFASFPIPDDFWKELDPLIRTWDCVVP